MFIELWLSRSSVVACSVRCGLDGEVNGWRLCSSDRSQTPSFPARLLAMYSASVLEVATVRCLWLDQLIAPLHSMYTNPLVDPRVSTLCVERRKNSKAKERDGQQSLKCGSAEPQRNLPG